MNLGVYPESDCGPWGGCDPWVETSAASQLGVVTYISVVPEAPELVFGDGIYIAWFRRRSAIWQSRRHLVRARMARPERRERDLHGMSAQVRAQLGREVLEGMAPAWKRKFDGKFVAISLRGRSLIAQGRSLAELYDTLALLGPSEDVYIALVGSENVGPLLG